MAVVSINKDNYESEVLKSEKPVILDFWATWCVPCRQVGKVVEELDAEMDTLKICKLNVEDCPELAASLGVISIPALIVFVAGKPVQRYAGAISKKGLLKKLTKAKLV